MARRPAGGSCPVVHRAVGHGSCNSANSAGTPATKSETARAATTTHATRARTRERPRSGLAGAVGRSGVAAVVVGASGRLILWLLVKPSGVCWPRSSDGPSLRLVSPLYCHGGPCCAHEVDRKKTGREPPEGAREGEGDQEKPRYLAGSVALCSIYRMAQPEAWRLVIVPSAWTRLRRPPIAAWDGARGWSLRRREPRRLPQTTARWLA